MRVIVSSFIRGNGKTSVFSSVFLFVVNQCQKYWVLFLNELSAIKTFQFRDWLYFCYTKIQHSFTSFLRIWDFTNFTRAFNSTKPYFTSTLFNIWKLSWSDTFGHLIKRRLIEVSWRFPTNLLSQIESINSTSHHIFFMGTRSKPSKYEIRVDTFLQLIIDHASSLKRMFENSPWSKDHE